MFSILPRSWQRSIRIVAAAGCLFLAAEVARAADFAVYNHFQLRNAMLTAVSGDTITFGSDIPLETLYGNLPALSQNVTIVGNGFTLDGGNAVRAFTVTAGTVTIQDLTIINARAQGGAGEAGVGTPTTGGGGGGAGLGGAIFVGTGANVTVTNVNLIDNRAQGGNGGAAFSLTDPPGDGGSSSNGAAGGTGGAAVGASGTNGNIGGGGGGAGANGDPGDPDALPTPIALIPGGNGGAGGYGGGGGGGGSGGGSSPGPTIVPGTPGTGGAGGGWAGPANVTFGGGAGGDGTVNTAGQGGGGAGFGGAVFVEGTGTITFGGTLTVNGNTVAGGTGANSGNAFGNGMFLQPGTVATFAPGAGVTPQVFSNVITDEFGSTGFGGSGSIVKLGDGTTILLGNNSYSGGTLVSAGILQGNTNSLQGSIVDNATVVFDQGFSGIFNGTLTGTGQVIKINIGILTYDTTQDNRGGTFINGGTLNAAGVNVLPGGQDIFIRNSGSALILNDNNQSIGGLFGDAGTTVDLGAGVGALLTIDPTSTITNPTETGIYSGNIFGTGAILKNGPGTQILLGTNTYSGGTTISGGILQGHTNSLQGNINFTGPATLIFDQSFNGTFNGAITSTNPNEGVVIKNGTGILTYGAAQANTGGTIVNAGTLRMGGVNYLPVGGEVTVNAGVLDLNNFDQSIGGLNGTGGTVQLGTGILTVNPATTATYAGSIQGQGTFIKNGGGTQILTGTNTYTGGTIVNGGILQGNTNSLQGTILNDAQVVFDQNFDGTFNGNIGGSGSVTKNGTGRLIYTTANSYTGGTFVNAGILQGNTDTLLGNIFNNASVVFDQAVDGTFTGTISGTGDVTKQNAGTLFFNTPQTYTGLTTINQGIVAVSSSLAGPVLVNIGGALVGNGSVGSTTVNGTIAPGNLGTLTVNGNYTQNGGSNYRVFINSAGQNDRINVTGAAQINGGNVEVVPASGGLRRGQQFTILAATGGVNGQYSSLSGGVPGYMSTRLIYNPFDVQLALDSNFLGGLGGTDNQQSIEDFFDGLVTTPGSDLDNIILLLDTLPPDQARLAFDQIGGAQHASLLTVGRMKNFYMIKQIGDQLRSSLYDDAIMGMVVRGQAPVGETIGTYGSLRTWVTGYGNTGRLSSNGNAPGIDYNFNGAVAGVENNVDGGTRIGLLAGYTNTNADFSGPSGTARGDGIVAGIYGARTFGNLYAMGTATYGFTDYTTTRQITFVGREAKADPEQNDFNAYLETGYSLPVGALTVQPFGGVQYMYLNQQGFTETGANSLNLVENGQDTQSLWAFVGGRLMMPIQSGEWLIKPMVHGRWINDCFNEDRLITGTLTGVPGGFTVEGAQAGRQYIVAGAGISFQRSNLRLMVDYSGLTNDNQNSHTGSAGVEIRW